MMRKTGKSLRQGALFRQIVQTWRENQAPWRGNLEHASKSAWKVQRICVLDTDSLQKSGKSTDSLVLSGKSYRIFAEVRRAWCKPCDSAAILEEKNFSPCASHTVKRTVRRALERATRHAPERATHATKPPSYLRFLNNI